MKQQTLFKHVKGCPAPAPTIKDFFTQKPKSTAAEVEEDVDAGMGEPDLSSAASKKRPAPSGDKENNGTTDADAGIKSSLSSTTEQNKPGDASASNGSASAPVSPPRKKARATSPSTSSTPTKTATPIHPLFSPKKNASPKKSTRASPEKKNNKASSSPVPEDEDEEEWAIGAKRKSASAKGKKRVIEESEDEQQSEGENEKKAVKGKERKMSSGKGKKQAAVAVAVEDVEEPLSGESEIGSEVDSELENEVEIKASSKLAEAANKKVFAGANDYPVWTSADPVPYAALILCFTKIESTTKRLEILAYLTQFLVLVAKRAAPVADQGGGQEVLKVVYLCLNRLCPDYMGLELGIGESLLMKAIAESTGRSLATIKADLKKEGDLGLVAMNSRKSQPTMFKPKPLTVQHVFSKLTEIAKCTGNASQARKIGIIKQLLSACQGVEAKFIIRSLEGKLRIRLAEKSVIVALAHAIVEAKNADKNLSPDKLAMKAQEGTEIVKAVFSELPNLDLLVPALVKVGTEGLRAECKLTPGIPLKPMLAKPTKAITEVLDRFEGKKFTCEYKYDGERAQVHRTSDGSFAVFSRNSENMSAKYPDLVEQLPRCIKGNTVEFVLDCEAVAWDAVNRKLLPFQELSKRKRKDVKTEDITIRVHMFAFDILYLNGESLLQKPLSERRELLRAHFQPVEGEFAFAKSSDGESSEEIQAFLEDSVRDGCEGLMVKMLETNDSTYEPSRRSMNWLKLKKDYLDNVGDSLDLVVVGAYHGKGKRTNVYGAFLLACYDPETEGYQTICKIGTGFSDEILEEHHATLKELETPSGPRKTIQPGGAKPDVWFEPRIVWEVLAADLSLSPIYTAAQGIADSRGISLRFPRFIRIRDDKSADDATAGEQIAEMYQAQAVVSANKKSGGSADDFW